jgi:hypothetical protein
MLIAVNGFGSVWRQRFGNERNGMSRISRMAFYNTTGVTVNGVIRTRAKIVGHVRFNGMGGFDPNYPSRMIDRVFECAEPSIWEGQNKVLFSRMLPTPQRSDYFLVVVRPEQVGRLDLTRRTWKSEDSLLISFSEWHEWQEAMLLMPPYAWLRSDLGTFFLEPLVYRPWTAQLRLGLSAGNRICDTPRVPSN